MIALVILQKNVVLGLVLLDKTALEHKCLVLSVSYYKIIVKDVFHHLCHLRRVVGRLSEITGNTVFKILRLADVDDLTGLVFHFIDAGEGGKSVGFFSEIG